MRRTGSAWTWACFAMGASLAPVSAQTVEVSGIVVRGTDGSGLAGATVVATDADMVPVATTATDAVGRFTLRAPEGGWISAAATGFASSAPIEVVAGLAPPALRLHRLYPRADEEDVSILEGSGFVRGVVLDATTAEPIANAQVTLDGFDRKTLSGRAGRFFFEAVPAGTFILRVEVLGYGTREVALSIGDRQDVDVRVDMASEAIELPELEVTVRPSVSSNRVREALRRSDRGIAGQFIHRELMELRGNPPLASLLREVSSLRIQRTGPYSIGVLLRGDCRPAFFLDGRPISGGADAVYEYLQIIPTHEFEMVEIYPGPAGMPPEYTPARCAIGLWSRR